MCKKRRDCSSSSNSRVPNTFSTKAFSISPRARLSCSRLPATTSRSGSGASNWSRRSACARIISGTSSEATPQKTTLQGDELLALLGGEPELVGHPEDDLRRWAIPGGNALSRARPPRRLFGPGGLRGREARNEEPEVDAEREHQRHHHPPALHNASPSGPGSVSVSSPSGVSPNNASPPCSRSCQ